MSLASRYICEGGIAVIEELHRVEFGETLLLDRTG